MRIRLSPSGPVIDNAELDGVLTVGYSVSSAYGFFTPYGNLGGRFVSYDSLGNARNLARIYDDVNELGNADLPTTLLGVVVTMGNLAFGPPTTSTIVGGVCPFTSSSMGILPESGVADQLDQISGGQQGQIVSIHTTDPTHTITVAHSGVLRTVTGANVIVASEDTRLWLECVTPGVWAMPGASS